MGWTILRGGVCGPCCWPACFIRPSARRATGAGSAHRARSRLSARHRLHYRCDGDGTPAVILEAGIAASSLTWSRVQPAIARETRVCSYDRAGLAWSEAASSARSMAALVSELRACCSRARTSHLLMCSSPIRLARSSSGRSRARIRQRWRDWCSSIRSTPRNGAIRRRISGRCFAAASFCRGSALCLRGLASCASRLALLSGGAPGSAPTVQPPVRPQGGGAARAPGRRSAEAAAGGAAVSAGALVESESVPRHVAAPRGHALVLCGSRARRRRVR